jgi:flagellar basal body-associated protein FliL
MASKLNFNKRADVAITILVIGVFAICALAIISFILYNQQTQTNFITTDTIENLSVTLNNFYLYVNLGLSPQDAANKVGAQLEGNQLILNAEQDQPPSWLSFISPKNQSALLSVKYFVDLSK